MVLFIEMTRVLHGEMALVAVGVGFVGNRFHAVRMLVQGSASPPKAGKRVDPHGTGCLPAATLAAQAGSPSPSDLRVSEEWE
jgi:hypothetical protein